MLVTGRRMIGRLVPLAVMVVLAACTGGPQLGAGIGIGRGGVSVYPSVSGNVGGVGVNVGGLVH